jgi:hypothetical protein
MALPTSENEVTVRKLSSTLQGLVTKISTKFGTKADKVSNATSGNFAGLDANGNLTDSSKKASDFATSAQGGKADSAIQSVKVNGTALTPDSNKAVNIPLASSSANGAMSKTDKSKLDGIASGAQVNVIETIKRNGTALTPDENKAVDISVPTPSSTASDIKMDGTQSAGSSSNYARADHVHPTDTSRENAANRQTSSLTTTSTSKYPSSKVVADFVNSSIATNTANFLGTYDVVTDLGLTTSATNAQIATALGSHTWPTGVSPTNNDYVFVSVDDSSTTTPAVADEYRRFKYNGTEWAYEYTLNNSSFTAAQWAAINSGLASTDKTKLDGIESGAQVNVIESVKVNGTAQTVTSKAVDIAVPTASSTTPKMDGSASAGSENKWAKGDHRHPTDTSREAASNKKTTLDDTSDTDFPTSKAVATYVGTAILTKVDKVEGKGLSTNDYTNAEKDKLAGIAAGAEVNQNAFSNVKVGSTTVAADSKTDTLTLAASGATTITANESSDKITISSTDQSVTAEANHYNPSEDSSSQIDANSGTVTQLPTASSGGTRVNVVVGLKRDSKGHVVGAVSKDIWSPDNNTTYTNPKLSHGYASSTAGTSPAFTAAISNYTLDGGNGGFVAIRFSADVPANATLNINSKGAKNIYWKNAAVVAGVILSGDTAFLMYDGSKYHLLGVDRSVMEMTTAEVDDLVDAISF